MEKSFKEVFKGYNINQIGRDLIKNNCSAKLVSMDYEGISYYQMLRFKDKLISKGAVSMGLSKFYKPEKNNSVLEQSKEPYYLTEDEIWNIPKSYSFSDLEPHSWEYKKYLGIID